MICATAPGKIILLGEHAVVYGEPAIAVPLSEMRAQVTILPADDFFIDAPDIGAHHISISSRHPLVEVVKIIIQELNIPLPAVQLTIASAIPVASGLGSGAAISAALVRVLAQYLAIDLPTQQINQIVYQTELLHHGTPSGIDNTVIVYEEPVYFLRGKSMEQIQNRTSFHLLIADTGVPAPTKISVGDVRQLMQDHPDQTQQIISRIGVLVRLAREKMQLGAIAELGKLMTENHRLLQALTVSSAELDRLVDAALGSGALGAKLSGGGRGGNMIALVTPDTVDQVTSALLNAQAVRVYRTSIGAL